MEEHNIRNILRDKNKTNNYNNKSVIFSKSKFWSIKSVHTQCRLTNHNKSWAPGYGVCYLKVSCCGALLQSGGGKNFLQGSLQNF